MATTEIGVVTKTRTIEETVHKVLPDGSIREKIFSKKIMSNGWTLTEKIIRTETPPSSDVDLSALEKIDPVAFIDSDEENWEDVDDDNDEPKESQQAVAAVVEESKKEIEPVAPVEVKPKKKLSALDALREELLRVHNIKRAKHNACDLVLSDKLNSTAQEWAEYLASRNVLQHRTNLHQLKYGENIFMTYDMQGAVPAKKATQNWYSEISQYNYSYGGFSMNTGHFTQVVWKGSKEVGFGRATSNSNAVFVVANYFPAGNMQGQFQKNVSPPNDESTETESGAGGGSETVQWTQCTQPQVKTVVTRRGGNG